MSEITEAKSAIHSAPSQASDANQLLSLETQIGKNLKIEPNQPLGLADQVLNDYINDWNTREVKANPQQKLALEQDLAVLWQGHAISILDKSPALALDVLQGPSASQTEWSAQRIIEDLGKEQPGNPDVIKLKTVQDELVRRANASLQKLFKKEKAE
jgi:hypothetical protein